MNDILVPLCSELGVNLVTSTGFQSLTNAIALLIRSEESGKPAHVFYLSDHDPAGDSMATAVARQLEFWRHRHAPRADIKLQPLFTAEVVEHYRLPR